MAQSEILHLPERFDYGYHKKFTESYMSLLQNTEIKGIILDFSCVEYLDSSALGMMVLIQKKFKDKNKNIKVRGASGTTEEILKMANMNKLFEFI